MGAPFSSGSHRRKAKEAPLWDPPLEKKDFLFSSNICLFFILAGTAILAYTFAFLGIL